MFQERKITRESLGPSTILWTLLCLIVVPAPVLSSVSDYSMANVETGQFDEWSNSNPTSFLLAHTDLSKPSSDHRFTWIFGDGTREEAITMTKFRHSHVYTRRGLYDVSIVVTDSTAQEYEIINFQAEVGFVQVTQSSPLVFTPITTQTVDLSCSKCTSTLTMNAGNGSSDVTVSPANSFDLYYNDTGDYDITITSDETVTLSAIVKEGPNSPSPKLEVLPSTHATYVAGEDVSFKLSFDDISQPVTCTIDYDNSGNTGTHNLTPASSSKNVTYVYNVPKTYNPAAYCWNSTDYFQSSAVTVVLSEPISRLTISSSEEVLTINNTDIAYLKLTLDADKAIPALTIDTVEWGDGQKDSDVTVIGVNAGDNDLTDVDHRYSLPGLYQIEVKVHEDIADPTYPLPKIGQFVAEVIKLKGVSPTGTIFTEREFQMVFTDLPVHDIGYVIDLGDDVTPPLVYTPSDFAALSSFVSPVILEYPYAGSYTMNVTVFNNYFNESQFFPITVDQGVPIRGWELVVAVTETIVVEESEVGFKIKYQDDISSLARVNVSCSMSIDGYTNASWPAVTVDFPFTSDLPWKTTFHQEGTYLISLTCVKGVSTHSLEFNLTAVNYTESNYTLTYEEVIPVDGTPDTENTEQSQFTLGLFDITLPFDHETEWDFGDDSPPSNRPFNSWNFNYLYEKRGVYTGSVKIFTPKGVFRKAFTVYIGLSQMTATPDAAVPDSKISVFCWEVRQKVASFKVFYGDGSSNTTSGNQSLKEHKYDDAGFYDIRTIVTIGSLREELTYSDAVFIDNAPNKLQIQLDESVVYQPPGEINLKVKMKNSGKNVEYMECVIDYGDLLDQRPHFYTGGLKKGKHFRKTRMYIALGFHTIHLNCSNRVGFFEATDSCQVNSECFSQNGIFEKDYANPMTPMYIMSSIKVLVTSRVDILCHVTSIGFEWSLYTLNHVTYEPETKIDIVQPKKDTFQINKGFLDPDIYMLTLNVSMAYGDTAPWLYGLTYIKVVGSPLIAKFTGGVVRATGNSTAQINARRKSHDPDLGLKYKGPLIFEWKCTEYVDSLDLETLEKMLSLNIPGSSVTCDDISQEVTKGLLQFQNIPEVARGYAFEVTVSTDTKSPVKTEAYVQYTKGAPEVEIQCLINCASKTAVTMDFTLEVKCPYCFVEDFDQATITWTLLELTSDTAYTEVNDLHTFTEVLDDNKASIVIHKNSLKPCIRYILRAFVDMPTREAPGQCYANIYMNCPPISGVCVTEPTSGEARTTSFKTSCSGWVDEGYEGSAGAAPLIYKFYVAQGDVAVPIFQGAQSLSPNKTLPIIPGTTGGQYNIMVRIFDVLNDYTEVNNTITLEVTRVSSINQIGEASQAAFSSQLSATTSVLTKQLFETTYSSSIYQTVDVGTLDSFIDDYIEGRRRRKREDSSGALKQTTTQAPTPAPDEPSWQEVWDTFVKQEEDSGTKKQIAGVFQSFTSQIKSNIESVAELNGQGLEAIGEALTTLMYSEETTDFETTEMGNQLVDSGADTLETLTSQDPYPFGEKVDEVVYGLAGALDRILNKNSPTYTTNDTTIKIRSGGIGEIESLFFQQRILDRKASEDNIRINKSRDAMPTFENSTGKILNAMKKSLVKGQKAKNIGRGGITFTASKSTARSLKGKEIDSDDFSFAFPDAFNETVNQTDEVILKATVTKKNPFSWSNDHSSYDVTSPVLNVALETSNGTSVFGGNVSLKLHRPMPEFNIYQVTETRAGEDEFCHHQFQLKKASETGHVFLDVGGDFGPVKAYFRNGLPPTTYSPNVVVKAGEYASFNSSSRRRKRSTGSGSSTMLRFVLQPGEMPVGLIYVGLDFSRLTVNISHYSLLAYSDSCRVWDRENNIWSNTACKVSPYSTPFETVCNCRDAPGYNFASSFYVPPNLINFNMVFSKFDVENAAVYGTVMGLFFVFGLAMVWAHWKGRQDLNRWKVGYLKDNFVGDHYFYLLTVHTGLGGSSGTRSRVSFILTGSKGDSGVRMLSDGQRYLETGTVMCFIMATEVTLGDLTYLRVWHDNSGYGSQQSWYLNKIYVEDIQTNVRSTFVCDQWLGIDKDDGLIDRIIPVSFYDDIMTFSKLFAEHSRINISDSHLWMSIFLRPERSMFTRLQRVTCCLLTLLLAMISSALFYQPEDVEGNSSNAPGTEFRVGILRFSTTTLFTSVIGIVITLPPILLIVCLFKSRRPWRHRCCSGRNKLQQEQEKTLAYYLKRAMDHEGVVNTNEDPLVAKFERNPLPSWCLIVAWTLLIVGILTSAFAIILYSMQWGKTVSEQWLASFVLSFFESIFILDPIKVLFLSALFALCMRNPGGDTNSNIPIDEIGQQSQLYGCKELDVSVLPPDPLPEEVLEKARKRKAEENIANGVFVELLLYVFFVFCLFSVSYGNRDGQSFILNDHLQNTLTKIPFRKAPQMYYATETEAFTWLRIKRLEDVYTWLNETMVSSMLPWDDLAGNALSFEERQFISDLANYRLGPVRIRQVRMPREIPPSIKEDPFFIGPKITNQDNLVGTVPRSMHYDISREETDSYCLGWEPQPCSYSVAPITREAWTYRSSADEKTFPVVGKFHVYNGAAYVVDLLFTRHIVHDAFLVELRDNGWLDLQTRAVFVEFSLYNANLNLFVGVRLVAEFPEYGGAFTSVDVKPKRFYDHVGPLGTYVLICQVVMTITGLVFTVKLIKKIVQQKLSFFFDGWNHLDFLVVLICMATVIFYILRKIFFSEAIDDFKEDPKVFFNLYRSIVFDDIYGWLLGALVFFCTLRLMRILGYNKRITMIAAVLKRASNELLSFAIVFVIAMSAFALTGYTLFHANLASFMSIWESFETLIYLLLGKNVFKQMVVVSAVASRIYFFILSVAIVWFFMTIFQSILNASASQVRLDVTNTPTPYGVMDVAHKIYRSIVLDNRIVEYIKARSEKIKYQKSARRFSKTPTDITQTQKVLSVLREHFYKSIGHLGPDQQNIANNDTMEDAEETQFNGSESQEGEETQSHKGYNRFDRRGTQFLTGDPEINRNGSSVNEGDSWFKRDTNVKGSMSKFQRDSFLDKVGLPANEIPVDLRSRVNSNRHPQAPPIPPSSQGSGRHLPKGAPVASVQTNWDKSPNARSPWAFSPAAFPHNITSPAASPFQVHRDNVGVLGNPTSAPGNQKFSPFLQTGEESNTKGRMPSVFRRANADDD